MDTLEGLGIHTDDTALFFTSDNGGVRNMIERDGEPNTHNAPLNSGKGSTYEGGLRVPMLAKWPGVTEAGSVSRTPITIEDMFPRSWRSRAWSSAARAVRSSTKKARPTWARAGRAELCTLLRGEAGNPERTLYWHFPHAWGGLNRPRVEGPGIGATSTIKRGDWKLVYWHVDGRKELFNLRDDISRRATWHRSSLS